MWAMLDEMAASDPKAYQQFMKEQMQSAAAPPKRILEVPTAGFCVRLRLEGGAGLFVNVCSHSRIKPPAANDDGTVPIAVGVPREAKAPGQKKGMLAASQSFAVDAVVSAEVTRRADMDAAYREEVGSLASECSRDVLSQRALLPRQILPGYRVLAASSDGSPLATFSM